MGRDILAVALLALGTALAIALVTFSALDGQLIAHDVPPASNLVGPVGHHVARALFRVLGFSALVLPVALVVTAISLFKGQSPRLTLIGTGAYAVLTASVATLAHLFLSGRSLASFSPGGAVGRLFCTRAESLFGSVGTALVVGGGAMVALIVATDVKVQKVWAVTWAAVRAAWGWTVAKVADAIDRHRIAVAEMRAEEAVERAREEELTASAVVEAAAGEEQEGRAMAGALVREKKRSRLDDEPAWVTSDEDEDALPRRRRRGKEEGADGPLATPLPLALAPEPTPEPFPVEAAPGRPEIVISAAMQERSRKKKSKDAPEFAFMQSGEVFHLPPVSLLQRHEQPKGELDESGMQKTAEIIVSTLRQHGVDGAIRHIRQGPVVTLYEFMPVAGVKLSRIENLDKELTMSLSAVR
ncbi:MAG: DNA translocase FtsK 4TM domain-containing protein, partial [Deltaproteobacteria bacterium]|nr:DNA translocase FtsK 4TM domain-containing protein [Deltaproteobacteria bacterium]